MLKFDPHQINLYRPARDSHKGQNGKLLVIGGSKLFHSSIFWSADVASKIVDLVHLTSPANENNQIFRKRLKEKFWNGIVVDWADVENYINEDDCVLIGPGMIRDSEIPEHSKLQNTQKTLKARKSDIPRESENLNLRSSGNQDFRYSEFSEFSELKTAGENDQTSIIVNSLLRKYPAKKWVLDGGALQEVDPALITESCILTPHKKEFLNLADKSYKNYNPGSLSKLLNNCTVLLKGPADTVCQGDRCVEIEGGNPGMTKGGTGDCLAGLVAGLYCKNDSWIAATVGSWVNKTAGNELFKRVGPYFNAQDLVEEVPKILGKISGRV